jgi:AP2 domain
MESSSSSDSDYMTVWSAPPKKPSGRTKFKETRHPVYRGVRRRGALNRWVCEVRDPNNKSRIWLGTFRTAEKAARAHDVAAMALQGRSACLNFADSAWLISIPASFSSVQDLKRMAVEVAEALHSKDSSYSTDDMSPSASSAEMTEETEVISSLKSESKTNLAANDQMEFNCDGDGDMYLGLYYASLAEALMIEPPAGPGWFNDLDDNQWGAPVCLWS